MRDTRVMRGAGFGSNHEMVMTNLKLKFYIVRKQNSKSNLYNLIKLSTPDVRREYQVVVGGRFAVLMSGENNLETEEKWRRGKKILHEEAERILGKKRHVKQPWMTQEALEKCDERREAKKIKNRTPTQDNLTTYRQKSREVDRKALNVRRCIFITRLTTIPSSSSALPSPTSHISIQFMKLSNV